ncbi:hypothetical protein XK09_07205 [Campylobacter lanienae]|uniref:Transcriptional regulator n=1 Tax=Campylobacter lanienae TaxID=75658 RepID=A0ABY3G677_9BACT|nr:hypothetical protein [Campylobacter lanienae]TWO27814.1 hypothetical protein XK09_07205 [Campylobacter lanienae]
MRSNETHNPSNTEGIVLLDTKQLKELIKIKGDATLWRYLKEGKIPQPKFAISRTKRIWDRDEVLNHLNKFSGGDK